MTPQSLIHIRGDRGPIETIELTVRKDIAKILGAAVRHTQRVDTNGNLFFLASKEDSPMADVVNVVTIGAVDILRLGPSDDTLYEKRHDLSCPSLDLRRIFKRIRV